MASPKELNLVNREVPSLSVYLETLGMTGMTAWVADDPSEKQIPITIETNNMMKILMILTSHSELGDTGKKTGFWVEEFAAPYYELADAGAEITLASPKGGQPPIDPSSQLAAAQTQSTHRFDKDEPLKQKLAHTLKLSDVKASDYDAVFYPGRLHLSAGYHCAHIPMARPQRNRHNMAHPNCLRRRRAGPPIAIPRRADARGGDRRQLRRLRAAHADARAGRCAYLEAGRRDVGGHPDALQPASCDSGRHWLPGRKRNRGRLARAGRHSNFHRSGGRADLLSRRASVAGHPTRGKGRLQASAGFAAAHDQMAPALPRRAPEQHRHAEVAHLRQLPFRLARWENAGARCGRSQQQQGAVRSAAPSKGQLHQQGVRRQMERLYRQYAAALRLHVAGFPQRKVRGDLRRGARVGQPASGRQALPGLLSGLWLRPGFLSDARRAGVVQPGER